MELKDVILSTLAEMDMTNENDNTNEVSAPKQETVNSTQKESISTPSASAYDEEQRYLESIRERLLVLFEGFQSPNNTQIEAKVDLTLNFLEYLLATIDTRLDKLKQ